MAIAASGADMAIVGADAILADGSFANKTGALPLALGPVQEQLNREAVFFV
jgi:translation initiation factor 2B subunit (eIF-2B alpha/beta/delta family)